MTRTWIITCIKGFSDTSLLPRPYFPSLIFAMYALLLIVFPAPLSHAEEAKVFTDADLANYRADPMVDQETAARMNDDLKSYEKRRDAEYLLDKERSGKRRAEEAKRAELQRQKQDTAMSRTAISRQGNGNNSVTYTSSPTTKKKT